MTVEKYPVTTSPPPPPIPYFSSLNAPNIHEINSTPLSNTKPQINKPMPKPKPQIPHGPLNRTSSPFLTNIPTPAASTRSQSRYKRMACEMDTPENSEKGHYKGRPIIDAGNKTLTLLAKKNHNAGNTSQTPNDKPPLSPTRVQNKASCENLAQEISDQIHQETQLHKECSNSQKTTTP